MKTINAATLADHNKAIAINNKTRALEAASHQLWADIDRLGAATVAKCEYHGKVFGLVVQCSMLVTIHADLGTYEKRARYAIANAVKEARLLLAECAAA